MIETIFAILIAPQNVRLRPKADIHAHQFVLMRKILIGSSPVADRG